MNKKIAQNWGSSFMGMQFKSEQTTTYFFLIIFILYTDWQNTVILTTKANVSKAPLKSPWIDMEAFNVTVFHILYLLREWQKSRG